MINSVKCCTMSLVAFLSSIAYSQEPILMPGWPVAITGEATLSAPMQGLTLFDLNIDGYQEILLSFGNKIHCFDYVGNELPGWPYETGNILDNFVNSPVVGDIDGDNEPEIVCDWRNAWERHSALIALHADGSMCSGFPIDMAANGSARQLALYDLDGDSADEIIIGLYQHYPDTIRELRVYRGNGEMLPGWPVEDIFVYGIAVGDIDNDSEPEIVVGGDGWADRRYDLFAFKVDGTIVDGFPVELTLQGENLWSRGAPSLFDLEGDGFLEIAQVYYESHWPDNADYYFGVFDNHGQMIDNWPYFYSDESMTGAAVSQNTSRGDYYFAIGTFWGGNYHLVSEAGSTVPGWPFDHGDYAAGSYDQATIGDIDGDGFMDYLFNYNLAIRDSISQPWMGRIWGLNQWGEVLEYFPLWVVGTTFPGGVSLSDIDNDGIVEMAFQAVYPDSGQQIVYVYKLTGIPYEPERFPWPMSCHDPQHTNNLTFKPETGIPYDDDTGLPKRAFLKGNYPNPFNAKTTIEFGIPKSGHVNLRIYNLLGQEVATIVDGQLVAGDHSVIWDASNYSSGIYFYRLTAGGKVITKRMTLLK